MDSNVFEKILHVYTVKKGQKNTLRKAFSRYPLVGLLNVEVMSIKKGMWDSMYVTFQLMATLQQENTQDDELKNYENIDIGRTEKGLNIVEKGESVPDLCVNVEDVLTKASEYLAGNVVLSGGSLLLDRVLMFVEKISCCELWLAQQFSVGEFKMLGHGEFWSFLGKNRSLFPKELLNFLTSEVRENDAFEVSTIHQQLVMLLSQALGSLWEDDIITKENLWELLIRQFPLISFKISERGGMEDLLDSVRQHNCVTSSCVIFSATLLGTSTYSDPVQNNKSEFLDSSELINCKDHKSGYPTSLTSKDAIEVLLRAPFLSDLNSRPHWDYIYAPSLGPLMEWLLTEVNVKDLVCLVNRHGKIIRIDHSASGKMLFQALVQESPFQVAVQLLSLFTLFGGRRHVPLSLLKCQTRQRFEVIISNPVRNMGLGGDQQNENMFERLDTSGIDSSMDLAKNLITGDRVVGLALRVVIDCLTFLPSKFCCFTADVLLSGLRSLVKDVNSAVLVQCKGTKEHLMLHEVVSVLVLLSGLMITMHFVH
ncbi:protein NO VEIN-like [Silene latifolia]|uniref:protein NO VEIN-like n=1 Tax=Silene latifolia TaxID=37657 RepID=UPI003D78AD02